VYTNDLLANVTVNNWDRTFFGWYLHVICNMSMCYMSLLVTVSSRYNITILHVSIWYLFFSNYFFNDVKYRYRSFKDGIPMSLGACPCVICLHRWPCIRDIIQLFYMFPFDIYFSVIIHMFPFDMDFSVIIFSMMSRINTGPSKMVCPCHWEHVHVLYITIGDRVFEIQHNGSSCCRYKGSTFWGLDRGHKWSPGECHCQ